MESLQIAFQIVTQYPFSALWLIGLGVFMTSAIFVAMVYKTHQERERTIARKIINAEDNAQEIVATAKKEAEAEAKEIVRKAEYRLSQVEMECDIRKSKIEAWLRHLEKTEANSRRMKEIVKGLLQHARRIKAEVDLAKKKDAREPSIRNIRQSCLRMLKLDQEADEIDKTIGQRPETF